MNRQPNPPRSLRRLTLASLSAAVALLAGCGTYKAGSGRPLADSVYIGPAVNESFLPQIDVVVTERLRDAFMGDSGVRLADRDSADAILNVTISEFSREGRAHGLPVEETGPDGNLTLQEDTGMARAFDLFLRAHVQLVDSVSGRVLLEDEFMATTQSIPTPYYRGSAEEERLLLPVLARDLARQIRIAIESRWEAPQDG